MKAIHPSANNVLMSQTKPACELRRNPRLAGWSFLCGTAFASLGVWIAAEPTLPCLLIAGFCYLMTVVYLIDRSVKLRFDTEGISRGASGRVIPWTGINSVSRVTVTKGAAVREYLRISELHGHQVDLEISRLDAPVERILAMFVERYEASGHSFDELR